MVPANPETDGRTSGVVAVDECMAVAPSAAIAAKAPIAVAAVMDVTDGGAATAAMAMRENDDED